MRRINYRHWVTLVLVAFVTFGAVGVFTGCGTIRSYWGVENEYEWGDGSHHHHKPPKHKKPKKHKYHKHDRKHHHHDD